MKLLSSTCHKFRLGLCNAYLIKGLHGAVLVDAGHSNHEQVFLRHMKHVGVSPSQVKLIVITHSHFDHVGSLKAIQRMCRCPVAVHEKEAPLLRSGALVRPTGTNGFAEIAAALGTRLATRLMAYSPVKPDILFSGPMRLEPYGVEGTVLPTPGHTKGSSTVLLKSGEAFVGDLAANYLPWGLGPIYPPFAEDVAVLFKSWAVLLQAGAKVLYPGHGSPFSAKHLGGQLRHRAGKG